MTPQRAIALCVLVTTSLTTPALAQPPKGKILNGALATSIKARAKRPFSIELTHVSSRTEYVLPSQAYCAEGELKLADELIASPSDAEHIMLSMLWIWLCEPYTVKSMNELGAHLDSDERTILADDSGFRYQLGSTTRSHLIADFELTTVQKLKFQASTKADAYTLAASVARKGGAMRLALSKNKRLVWTAKIKWSDK